MQLEDTEAKQGLVDAPLIAAGSELMITGAPYASTELTVTMVQLMRPI